MSDALRWMPVTVCARTLRRVVLLWLTVLVLVQTVGVLHRIAHPIGKAHAMLAVSSVDALTTHDVAPSSETAHAWSRLWGDHSSLADCQLFDQACPDGLHHTLFNALTLTVAHLWQVATAQAYFSLFERFYAARGPPAFH
jgi:hypothetical protein